MKTATPPQPVEGRRVIFLDAPDYPYWLQINRAAYLGAYAWSVHPQYSGDAKTITGRGTDLENAQEAGLEAIERQVLQLIQAESRDYAMPTGAYEGQPISEVPRNYLEYLARKLRHADPRRIAAVAELARRAEQERMQPALPALNG